MNSGKTFIDGEWIAGSGSEFASLCPTDNSSVWVGNESSPKQVADAFQAARAAFGDWWNLGDQNRIEICEKFASLVNASKDELAWLISRETGKPVWESKTEVVGIVGKIAVSVDAYRERRSTTEFDMGGFKAVTRFKPHGVCGVLGPFNFPVHLANGHIVPALIAGNTIVFKPSEQTPATGQWMIEKWQQAGIPKGVINLVQGARDVGIALSSDPQLDGLFFTGSNQAGKALHRAFSEFPQKLLALEMGGNGPLLVHEVEDLKAAAYNTILSAYFTAGQRCTCARRLILVDGESTTRFLDQLTHMLGQVRVGFFTDDPEPFMGTVISAQQGKRLLEAQESLKARGAIPLAEMKQLRNCEALLSPGLFDCTEIEREDEELFGPLLNIIRVDSFDAAIAEANNTVYGLSAALLSDSRENYEQFIHQIRAGIVNWNRQTTGATGKLPFGGCGMSGNNRPAAYYTADYCSFPTASLESDKVLPPATPTIGIEY